MSNKVYQIVTQQIVKQLQEVNADDWNKPWFAVGRQQMRMTGEAYRGINQILLANSQYSCNHWGSFKQWSAKKCKIKKGEKSRIVVYWNVVNRQDEQGNATNEVAYMTPRYYRVFNAEQVDGDYAETIRNKSLDLPNKNEAIASVESVIQGYLKRERLPVKVSDRAYYRPGMGQHIGMPDLQQFRDAESYYSVFAHEAVHSTGDKGRLEREIGNRFGTKEYAFEELVAEMGAAMFAGRSRLSQKPRQDHAQYLKSWLACLNSDPKFAFQAASKAQKAVDYIYGEAA